jgi:hypothetical protein
LTREATDMPSQPKPPIGRRWLNRNGTKLLSETYQRRLIRDGVTEAQFRDKTFKLDKARGHGETPERKIDASNATPELREKYKRYFGRQEGEVYILTTEGLKVFPRGEISIKDEKLIGGHWGKIGRFLEGDPIATQDIPTFKRAKKVGGYGQIPKMSLEYRIDEIEQAAARGILPDKPFTIGSD